MPAKTRYAVALVLFAISHPAFSDAGAQAPIAKLEIATDHVLPVSRDAYIFLHSYPELGKKELKAHDYLVTKLKAVGITDFVTSPSLPTAVIAVVDTGRSGPTIALRSELDARPLPDGTVEPASHKPRSQVAGIMHNCGHDAHAAILLGVAAIVRKNKENFAGRFVFLFQPAEEIAGGADDIVRDGALDSLGVQMVFALHSAPGMPVGTVAVAPGETLAGSSYFRLELSGRSSHAAAPFAGDDVALGAIKVAEELSELPARRIDISNRPAVISITSFTSSSGASNVLPATAEIKGTLRSYEDPESAPPGGTALKQLMIDRTAAVSAAYGITPVWKEFKVGSPPTRNDPALFARIVPMLVGAFPGKIDTTPNRSMYSEDFAYYTPHFPSLYFALGIAKDGLGLSGVHTADFAVHPDAFKVGITLMTLVAQAASTGALAWK
jgi:amidohydrolase